MAISAFGYSTAFIPTNSKYISASTRWSINLIIFCSTAIVFALLITGVLTHLGSLALGVTGLWVFLILSSPVVLFMAHILHIYSDNRSRKISTIT
jgi:hypothetical protein